MQEFLVELKPFDMENFSVSNVFFSSDLGKIPGDKFVSVSLRDGIQIKKTIEKEVMLLPKAILKDSEESIVEVGIDSFTKIDSSDITATKLQLFSKINNRINYQLAKIAGIELYEYFIIVTSFAERGIIINDQNREEKYLEIISSEDEYLINLLERYLEIKDKVDSIYRMYRDLTTLRTNISRVQTKEDLDSTLNNSRIKL